MDSYSDKFSTHRGNKIQELNDEWFYSDTMEPTIDTWKDKACGKCKLVGIDPDPCIGLLEGVMNACCGHGNTSEAYIQFNEYHIITGQLAIDYINTNRGNINGN